MRGLMKKSIAGLMAAVLLTGAMAEIDTVTCKAAADSQVVKVGIYPLGQFMGFDDEGNPTGYGVEYLEQIALYTDWEYEYVSCENWSEVQSLLFSGEIDIAGPLQYTAERAYSFYFPEYDIGSDNARLSVRGDDDRYFLDDYEAFQGMRVALVADSEINPVFIEFLEKNGIEVEFENFRTEKQCFEALDQELVDGVVSGGLSVAPEYRDVCDFSIKPFYFVTTMDNDELGKQLNEALGKIALEERDFESNLYWKYYENEQLQKIISYTRGEQNLLNSVTEKTIAFIPNRSPFSYMNEAGEIDGITYDMVQAISEKCGIKFQCVMMPAGITVMDYLEENPEHLVVGIMTENPAFQNQDYIISNSYYVDDVGIVCKEGVNYEFDAPDDAYVLAIPKSYSALTTYLEENCPQFQLKFADSVMECLDMLERDEVQFAAQNVHVLTPLMSNPHYENLTLLPAFLMDESMGFVARSSEENENLISIINKCIRAIPEQEVSQFTVNHMVVKGYEATFEDLLYKFRYPLIMVVILLLGVFVLLFVNHTIRQRHLLIVEENNQKLEHTNGRLEVAIQKANQANSAKSIFLAQMSHEIRTPMNAIIGLTTIAHLDINDPEKMEAYLSKIEGSSKILLGIINDVLDMSAIESHKMKIDTKQFNFKNLLSSITTIYYQQCKQKGIEYQMRLTNVSEEELIGDSLRVNQIMLNLLSNAVKFTPSGGRITVNVIQASKTREQVHMRFEITDTGCGMSEDLQKRLFRPFEQEDASTARKHGGSGLGLSISKNLVELMNGQISVKSKKDEGTTFYVDIPFGRVDSVEHMGWQEFSEIRALVIDDDEESCEYISMLLDRLGVQHNFVTDGQEGLAELGEAEDKDQMYDICIVDWKMPKMNGVEVTKQIREIFGRDTIVVIASAYDLNEVEGEARSAGADYFIPKPLFQSTLYDILNRIHHDQSHELIPEASIPHEYLFENRRVLIAEDVVLNMEVAVKLLELVGIQAECAEDGKQAYEMFEKSAPGYYDAILMDINMPVMDGYESARKIRASRHSDAKDITIYAMTANAFSEDVSRCMDAGMNGHIAKPIETQVLYRMLNEAFEKNKVQGE